MQPLNLNKNTHFIKLQCLLLNKAKKYSLHFSEYYFNMSKKIYTSKDNLMYD